MAPDIDPFEPVHDPEAELLLPFNSFRPNVAIIAIEPMHLRRWVANHRLRLGLTVRQAAEEAGVSKATISRIEAGKALMSPTLVLILKWLNRVRE